MQFFTVGNTSLAMHMSDEFCHAWDYVTGQYELVLHSEALPDDAGKEESEYNSRSRSRKRSIVIPDNAEYTPVTRTEYELTYYVNNVNTNNAQVLMEYDENGTLKNSYTYGNERISIDSEEEKDYYLYDGRGSVSQLVNADNIVEAYTYDPFENVTGGAPDFESFYGYNAEETNPVTGLQYLRARYYDGATGRFSTADSYLGDVTNPLTLNRYIYTLNNPVMYNDPSGHWFHIIGGIIAGAVVGAVTGVVSEAISAKVEGRKFNGKNAAKNAAIGAVSGIASGAIIATTGNIALASAAAGGISGAGNALANSIEQKKSVKETVKNTVVGGTIGTVSGVIGGAVSFGLGANPAVQAVSRNVVGKVITEATSVMAGSVAGGFVSETSTRVYNGENIKSAVKSAANPKTVLTNALTGLAGYVTAKAVTTAQNNIYEKNVQAKYNTTTKPETQKFCDDADSYQKQPEVEKTTPKLECDAAEKINGETSYGKSSGKLNWDAIVSKKGETRVDHINRHAVPNSTRETHGVFNGNPIDMVNQAWEQRHLVEPISDGMGGRIYNIPYKNAGYESGYTNTGAQMDYITIVTMDESADLITAFPSFGNYHK